MTSAINRSYKPLCFHGGWSAQSSAFSESTDQNSLRTLTYFFTRIH